VAELLGRAGYSISSSAGLLGAVDGWRRDRVVPMASVRALGAAVIAHFDRLSATNLLPYLPKELAPVPRANIEFLPIKDAWFSGSMNYLGRARKRMAVRSTKPPTRSTLRCKSPCRSSSNS
jgi:hypothetical protein